MKNYFLFILLTISFFLSSCKKDGEIKLTSTFCLKLRENSQFYEYDELNRIKETYYYDSDNKRISATNYTYSGDTIIKKYNVPDYDWTAQVIEKSIIGNNGFIQKTLYKKTRYNQSTYEFEYSYFYDEYNYLTKIINSKGVKSYFFYEVNGNLEEEWFVNGVDSFLIKKYEYDLLNENKEAKWKELVERIGKANRNLLLKEFNGDNLHVYSYLLKNGYPIAKQETYTTPNYKSVNYYTYSWSCVP